MKTFTSWLLLIVVVGAAFGVGYWMSSSPSSELQTQVVSTFSSESKEKYTEKTEGIFGFEGGGGGSSHDAFGFDECVEGCVQGGLEGAALAACIEACRKKNTEEEDVEEEETEETEETEESEEGEGDGSEEEVEDDGSDPVYTYVAAGVEQGDAECFDNTEENEEDIDEEQKCWNPKRIVSRRAGGGWSLYQCTNSPIGNHYGRLRQLIVKSPHGRIYFYSIPNEPSSDQQKWLDDLKKTLKELMTGE